MDLHYVSEIVEFCPHMFNTGVSFLLNCPGFEPHTPSSQRHHTTLFTREYLSIATYLERASFTIFVVANNNKAILHKYPWPSCMHHWCWIVTRKTCACLQWCKLGLICTAIRGWSWIKSFPHQTHNCTLLISERESSAAHTVCCCDL